MSAPIPEGFQPLATNSPYNTMAGPWYSRVTDSQLVIGLRVARKHCNTSGRLHGGMISSVLDVCLGHNMGMAMALRNNHSLNPAEHFATGSPGGRIATVSLNTNFLGAAVEGEWVECHAQVERLGRRLAFLNATVATEEKTVATAKAIFSVLDPST